MDIAEFMDHVKEQFDDAPETFSPSTEFRKVDGWCSLVALSIISMVDEEYNVTLTGNDIRNSATVRDLYDKVVAQKG